MDQQQIQLRPNEVARQFGRSSAWLRWLEREGLVPPAPRDFSNRRVYRLEDVELIRRVVTERRSAVKAPCAA